MIEIDDLADVPHHLDTVAERIWTAWWRDKGHGIERITVPLRESLERRAIPFTLVAHRDGGFCGTVSVIASDVSERPDLTPWIAALWIEPDLRRRGLGAALLHHAVRRAAGFGTAQLYLYASDERRAFYEGRGWRRLGDPAPEPEMTILTLTVA